MTDYVLDKLSNDESWVSDLLKIKNYANFLKQPLTLGMFVPCDDDSNALEEPKNYAEWRKKSTNVPYDVDLSKYEQYQQAKSKVLFEGFEVSYKSNISICVENENFDIRFKKDGTIDSFRFRIIEHLASRKPTLTQSAINKLNEN